MNNWTHDQRVRYAQGASPSLLAANPRLVDVLLTDAVRAAFALLPVYEPDGPGVRESTRTSPQPSVGCHVWSRAPREMVEAAVAEADGRAWLHPGGDTDFTDAPARTWEEQARVEIERRHVRQAQPPHTQRETVRRLQRRHDNRQEDTQCLERVRRITVVRYTDGLYQEIWQDDRQPTGRWRTRFEGKWETHKSLADALTCCRAHQRQQAWEEEA
jgi:hypothetical protein